MDFCAEANNYILTISYGAPILYNLSNVLSTQITMPKVKLSLLETKTFIYDVDVATRWAKWHLEKKYERTDPT